MNTGIIITTVGGIITLILTGIGGYFARKGDRNMKMTQRYFDDAEFNQDLLTAVRTDYWTLFGWASIAASKWHILIEGLPRVCAGNRSDIEQLMREVGDLPPVPHPEHPTMERRKRSRPESSGTESA